VSLTFHSALRKLNTEPSIGDIYACSMSRPRLTLNFVTMISVYRRLRFQRGVVHCFCYCWKLNTEPSIGASHQISVHFGKAVSEKKISKKSTNLKQELPVAAMFYNGSKRNEQSLNLLFILPCFVIFSLNYASVSFDFSNCF
jgi:hypothetical protein